MAINLITRRKNSRATVLFLLGLVQYHIRDWKGKDGMKTQESLMDIQAKIMDVREIPYMEFTEAQLELFEERKAA